MFEYIQVKLSELVRIRDWFKDREDEANYRNIRNAIEEITFLRREFDQPSKTADAAKGKEEKEKITKHDECPYCGIKGVWMKGEENEVLNVGDKRHYVDDVECRYSQLTQAKERIAELEAELAKWPRVYWYSSEPKSLEEGYRVMYVAGKTKWNDKDEADVWMDVYVDNPSYDGEWMAAPDDFGLYATTEEAKKAKEKADDAALKKTS